MDVCMCANTREVEVVMVAAIQAILLFLLELIRAANNSLLLFHLGNKPLKAVAFSDLE